MQDGQICYIEFLAGDMGQVQGFYRETFGWSFTDYGPSYACFAQGVDGGFQADAAEATRAPLAVIYASDLEAMLARVTAAGGEIVKPIFAFPGGRRFHFRDPSGNELAVLTGD